MYHTLNLTTWRLGCGRASPAAEGPSLALPVNDSRPLFPELEQIAAKLLPTFSPS